MYAGGVWPDYVWCTKTQALPLAQSRLEELLQQLYPRNDSRAIMQNCGQLSWGAKAALGSGWLYRLTRGLIPYCLQAHPDGRKYLCFVHPGSAAIFKASQIRGSQWHLESTSGCTVYQNGKPASLTIDWQETDWLFWQGLYLVRQGSIVFASLPLKNDPPAGFLKPISAIQVNSQWKPPTQPELEQFVIEAPDEPAVEENQAMASPAGMIVISSLASVISGYLLNPQNPAGALGGLASAGISVAGFCGWYGWNGHRQKQKKRKHHLDQINAYLAYLQKQMEQIETRRQQLLVQVNEQRNQIVTYSPQLARVMAASSRWQLPVFVESHPWGRIELPALSWKLDSTMTCKVLQQLEAMPLEMARISCLEQGGIYDLTLWSKPQIECLYLLWAWMAANAGRRFAWIGFPKPERIHPISCLEHQLLYFDSWSEFEACKSLHPEIEWTICCQIAMPALHICSQETILALWPDNPGIKTRPIFDSHPPDPALYRQSSWIGLNPAVSQKPERPACLKAEYKEGWRQEGADLCIELAPDLFWDLKKEGPHALCAGATGSGKSEGLCTMLFELACQNSSRFLQYVLIDFKGGSFCMPFADLPHTSGMLTNLDKAQIKRLERALNLELERRQEALSLYLQAHPGLETGIENCPDPMDGRPFAEIIVCVDEFGQLKARYPEFMKSLQEMARIGRSLGFHLILCTQKPAGLVDEQIWANSRSRLCFGVLDKADSKEVLGHDGAARLKNSGEFILQCGNESEKSGRTFYLKAPAGGKGEIRQLDATGLWQKIPQESFQDQMRRQILERNEQRKWLLHPDLAARSDWSGIMEDDLSCFTPYTLVQGENLLIAGESEKLSLVFWQIAALSDWPVTVASTQMVHRSLCLSGSASDRKSGMWKQERPGLSIENAAALWQMAAPDWSQPVLVGLKLEKETPLELVKALVRSPWISLVLLAERIEFRQEQILALFSTRLFAGLENRDLLGQFSEGRLSCPEAWPVLPLIESGMAREQYRRLAAGQTPARWIAKTGLPKSFLPVWLKPDLLELDQPHVEGLVGIDVQNFKPVCKSSAPFTIAWSAASQGQKAKALLLRMQAENPLLQGCNYPEIGALCLLDLSQQADPAMSLRRAMEMGDLLFLGPGLASCSYLLQIQLPAQSSGDALWINKGQVIDVMAAGLKDDS